MVTIFRTPTFQRQLRHTPPSRQNPSEKPTSHTLSEEAFLFLQKKEAPQRYMERPQMPLHETPSL